MISTNVHGLFTAARTIPYEYLYHYCYYPPRDAVVDNIRKYNNKKKNNNNI